MTTLDVQQTIGKIVTENPCRSRVFGKVGIDYCCGGKKTVAQACHDRGLDPRVVLVGLMEIDSSDAEGELVFDVAGMSLTDLIYHIEKTHHALLRELLPQLPALSNKVAYAYQERDRRLRQVHETVRVMAFELWCHMLKEEQCLFPLIRQLEAGDRLPAFHVSSLADPIRQMELEHDGADSALERLRELTDGFVPPQWACDTYCALLAELSHLERDMRVHIRKENKILFPRALKMELKKRVAPSAAVGAN